MSHFDYEQFLRQRGLVAPKHPRKMNAQAPSATTPFDGAEPKQPKQTVARRFARQTPNKSDDEFFNYDLPACSWNPGADDVFCGEGVICPPCG